jgi:hypothetical protein
VAVSLIASLTISIKVYNFIDFYDSRDERAWIEPIKSVTRGAIFQSCEILGYQRAKIRISKSPSTIKLPRLRERERKELDLVISVPGHFNMINYMNSFCASKAWRARWFGKKGHLLVSSQIKEELTHAD